MCWSRAFRCSTHSASCCASTPQTAWATRSFAPVSRPERLANVLAYPQNTYIKRIYLADGSYADTAIQRSSDERGIVVAYCHTRAEFADKSTISVQTLLRGYERRLAGTVVLVEGKRVVAANDPQLLNTELADDPLLLAIRESGRPDELVDAGLDENGTHCYGMYSHGRDYYLYVYLPVDQIYKVTPSSVTVTLIAYLVVLAMVYLLQCAPQESTKCSRQTPSGPTDCLWSKERRAGAGCPA